MGSGSGVQQSFRKAMEAIIKDSTSVGMANFISDQFKNINVSLLKATNHADCLPKEKHVGKILAAVSASRPRADVAYCILALKKRLAKTHSWVVALKTLIVIHRALREVDNSFFEELSFHSHHRGRMLNLSQFKDNSAPDCSSWIRTYAQYIEECLQCFRDIKYDFFRDDTRMKKLDTLALLQQLPALQHVLVRLLCCKPFGAAPYSYMIQYALSIVAADSVRLYVAITDGVLVLVDKFFEMERADAVPALDIYRRAVDQAQRLSEFFEMCRSLDFGQDQKYVKIEQTPSSFLTAMEDYIKDSPQTLMLSWPPNDDKCITVIPDPEKATSEEGSREETSNPEKSNKVDPPLIPDLMSWDEPSEEASESIATQGADDSSKTTIDSQSQVSSEATRWEAALPTTQAPTALCKEGVVNRSVLHSLYETAAAKPSLDGARPTTNVPVSNPFEEDDDRVYDHSMVYQQWFLVEAGIQQQQQGPQQSSAHLDISKHIVEMRLAQVPLQQQETAVVGHPSTVGLGNPFVEQGQLPVVAQNQSS